MAGARNLEAQDGGARVAGQLRREDATSWVGLVLYILLPLAALRAGAANELIGWGSTNYGLARLPTGVSNITQLAAGGQHALLLTLEGKVIAWGDNTDGQTNVPSDLGKVAALAAGANHSLALLADGSVRAWGDDTYGQCDVPVGLRAKAIAGGGNFSAAITTNGTLAVWGYSGVDMTPPPDFTNLVKIAAGDIHLLVQHADGEVLNLGGWPPMSVPPEATNVIGIAAGQVHDLALRADGTVVAWGLDDKGQATVPAVLTNVAFIAAGGERSDAVLKDGSVVEWGDTNWYTMPSGLTNVSLLAVGGVCIVAYGAMLPCVMTQPLSQSVFSGNAVTLAITASGTRPLAFQWLHDGAEIPGATNLTLTLPSFQQLDAGGYRVVVRNTLGETASADAVLTLIDAPPSVTVPSSPQETFRGGTLVLNASAVGSLPMWFQWQEDGTPIPGATMASLNVSPVSADGAGEYSVVVSNAFGVQVSAPVTVDLLPIAWWGTPARELLLMPAALTNAVAVSVRDWSYPIGLALLADGQVTAWGNPSIGRIPAGLTNVVGISAGDGFAMALRADGTVAVWGNNMAGEARLPQGLSRVIAVAGGAQHCLALKADGTVVAWGGDFFHQTEPPANLHDVVAVAAGYSHSVALRGDGSVVAWGNNVLEQTNVPTGLLGVVAISAGGDHTLALKNDGSVVAWGQDSYGQIEVPPGLSNVVALSAADNYSMALRSDGSLVLWGEPGAVTNLPARLEGVQGLCAANQSAYALLGDGLPAVFVPAWRPVFNDGSFEVSCDGTRGGSYRLESCGALGEAVWTLGMPTPGQGMAATLIDTNAVAPARFYRIRLTR